MTKQIGPSNKGYGHCAKPVGTGEEKERGRTDIEKKKRRGKRVEGKHLLRFP